MPSYDRNKDHPDRERNWWITYEVTDALAAQFGLNDRRVREPSHLGNKRASDRLCDMRERQVRDGTWCPSSKREAENLLVEEWAPRWKALRESEAELKTSKTAMQNCEDQWKRLETYVLPKIGKRPLAHVTRPEIKQLFAELWASKAISARTLHHVYDATRGMFKYALTAEPMPLIDRTPCTLSTKRGELPKKKDKDPRWRSNQSFTHDELYELFTDERNPIDRRTLYALIFFCANRFGEFAGRRWQDYDRSARPLGRIFCATQYNDLPLKMDGAPRDLPVHPFLAWMLDRWHDFGFELVMGRKPRPSDWIVPSRLGPGVLRSSKATYNRLGEDLERIGQRKRNVHALRAAFISLAQEDGGTRDVLELITHKGNNGGSGDVWSGYTRHPWHVLCDHVSRLRLAPPPSAPGSHSGSHSGEPLLQVRGTTRVFGRDGRDLKPTSHDVKSRNLDAFRKTAIERYLDFREDLMPVARGVTPRVTRELASDLRRGADIIRSGRIADLTGDERARIAAAADAAAEGFDAVTIAGAARTAG